jgi:hypothetical protein
MVRVRGSYVAVACFGRNQHFGFQTVSMQNHEMTARTGNRLVVVERLGLMDRRR